jgi:hypothetical protein
MKPRRLFSPTRLVLLAILLGILFFFTRPDLNALTLLAYRDYVKVRPGDARAEIVGRLGEPKRTEPNGMLVWERHFDAGHSAAVKVTFDAAGRAQRLVYARTWSIGIDADWAKLGRTETNTKIETSAAK